MRTNSGISPRLDDGLASVARHCCLWTGCGRKSFYSRDDLVCHVESTHVDVAVSDLQHDGDIVGEAVSVRRLRRCPGPRGRHDGRARWSAGAFRCGWSDCPRRWRPFNARYKLLIHTRIHTGDKPHRCTVRLVLYFNKQQKGPKTTCIAVQSTNKQYTRLHLLTPDREAESKLESHGRVQHFVAGVTMNLYYKHVTDENEGTTREVRGMFRVKSKNLVWNGARERDVSDCKRERLVVVVICPCWKKVAENAELGRNNWAVSDRTITGEFCRYYTS